MIESKGFIQVLSALKASTNARSKDPRNKSVFLFGNGSSLEMTVSTGQTTVWIRLDEEVEIETQVILDELLKAVRVCGKEFELSLTPDDWGKKLVIRGDKTVQKVNEVSGRRLDIGHKTFSENLVDGQYLLEIAKDFTENDNANPSHRFVHVGFTDKKAIEALSVGDEVMVQAGDSKRVKFAHTVSPEFFAVLLKVGKLFDENVVSFSFNGTMAIVEFKDENDETVCIIKHEPLGVATSVIEMLSANLQESFGLVSAPQPTIISTERKLLSDLVAGGKRLATGASTVFSFAVMNSNVVVKDVATGDTKFSFPYSGNPFDGEVFVSLTSLSQIITNHAQGEEIDLALRGNEYPVIASYGYTNMYIKTWAN
jgi:hypothetical protein